MRCGYLSNNILVYLCIIIVLYNNTRLGTFKNMIYYIISSSSHVLKLYNVYHYSKDLPTTLECSILIEILGAHSDEKRNRGIPEHISIFELTSPTSIKDVQKLTGRVATLTNLSHAHPTCASYSTTC